MPIKIPDQLPARDTLRSENIFVMTERQAVTQDIRPLRIGLLNLMPTKVATETQLARLLGNTPLQVELELITVESHVSKNTSEEHMLSFYKPFSEVVDGNFDGFIITGAPVEQLPFEEVDYWEELCRVMEWTRTHVTSTLHICWGAQAAMYYHYGIDKVPLNEKMSGVFPHTIDHKDTMLFRGFDDVFMVPHSRHTTCKREDIEAVPELSILASSDRAGVYAVKTHLGKQVFIFGHSEYDALTLDAEYRRDMAAGLSPNVPENYYPNDDPTNPPKVSWRSSANLMYSNWLNYYVYQITPFDISLIDGASGPFTAGNIPIYGK